MSAVPLSVLDLAPITSEGTPGEALRNSIDLARRAEEFGYHRYWVGEHHFSPGVASAAPAVLIATIAGATSRIRVGSGGVQMGHQTPLAVVEQFGMLDALYPGRIDLGLGRSGHRRDGLQQMLNGTAGDDHPEAVPAGPGEMVNGLLIPALRFGAADFARYADLPRFALYLALQYPPGARTQDFAEQVDDILALLDGTYRSEDGIDAHATPGEGAAVQVWILGSSAGPSAQVAAGRGIRFAANYHLSPSTVLETVEAYRAGFTPSPSLTVPYVIASADVVAAADGPTARDLASPYGPWVRSLRVGAGIMPYLSPREAAAQDWTDDDRRLVADRVDTQFVGSPAAVVEKLHALQKATGADELLITTITHDHADRVRSYQLLADAWADQ